MVPEKLPDKAIMGAVPHSGRVFMELISEAKTKLYTKISAYSNISLI